jgi:hypothetical protein
MITFYVEVDKLMNDGRIMFFFFVIVFSCEMNDGRIMFFILWLFSLVKWMMS